MLRRYVELLHERLGDRLRSVVLFGSVARGNWDESSDIDVLVVVDGWEGRLWDRLRVLLEVEGRLREGREYQEAVAKGYRPLFQPYPISTEEAQRTHAVYLDLVIDGVVLFDRDGFIAGVIEGVRRRLEGLGARRMVRPDGSHLWVLKEGARFGEGIEV
ncbi:TPA: nucleotidyltransferase domain-containing protein [Candidatus Bathyarchaeota archaeon]|nr:nucleotidyltransferase domain-containing protein [Candidatus Bathyarchaeota archaeon]